MNPTYAESEFCPSPSPQRFMALASLSHSDPRNLNLSVGIKTITHNRAGLKIVPHKVVALEMDDGLTKLSFDLNSSFAAALSDYLATFAAALQ